MLYNCPNCNRPDPTLSPLVMWGGCKKCHFGQKEFSMARWDFPLWTRLMKRALNDLEVKQLCRLKTIKK